MRHSSCALQAFHHSIACLSFRLKLFHDRSIARSQLLWLVYCKIAEFLAGTMQDHIFPSMTSVNSMKAGSLASQAGNSCIERRPSRGSHQRRRAGQDEDCSHAGGLWHQATCMSALRYLIVAVAQHSVSCTGDSQYAACGEGGMQLGVPAHNDR